MSIVFDALRFRGKGAPSSISTFSTLLLFLLLARLSSLCFGVISLTRMACLKCIGAFSGTNLTLSSKNFLCDLILSTNLRGLLNVCVYQA